MLQEARGMETRSRLGTKLYKVTRQEAKGKGSAGWLGGGKMVRSREQDGWEGDIKLESI